MREIRFGIVRLKSDALSPETFLKIGLFSADFLD